MHEAEVPMFEGRPITKFEVILPRVTVDAADEYKSGNLMRFATEMRVVNVQFKDNGDGTLTRQHFLSWENVEVVTQFDPADQILDGGTSSSTSSVPDDEGDDDLGLVSGRSGDAWPGNVTPMRASG